MQPSAPLANFIKEWQCFIITGEIQSETYKIFEIFAHFQEVL